MAITLSSSFIPTTDSQLRSFSGCSLKPLEQQCNVALSPRVLLPQPIHQRRLDVTPYKRGLSVQAAYSEGGKPISAGIFIGGFVLGGIIVGTLGCVYAPQISRALAGTDKKDLMRKLPKFIYDEEKALEKTRKILSEKIAQLNSAIDDVSSQLRAEDSPNDEATVESDDVSSQLRAEDSPNDEATVESDVVEAAI